MPIAESTVTIPEVKLVPVNDLKVSVGIQKTLDMDLVERGR